MCFLSGFSALVFVVREWMLAGTRNGRGAPSLEAFERQWRDQTVAPELRRLALEIPETLGALFIADAEQLREWTRGVPWLEDAWPRRISQWGGTGVAQEYLPFADARSARARFESSRWISRVWPPELRLRTLELFGYRGAFDDHCFGVPRARQLGALRRVLAGSPLTTLPLLLMGTDPTQIDIARRAYAAGQRHPRLELLLGVDALAAHDRTRAIEHFSAALAQDPRLEEAATYRDLALEQAPPRPF